jgi:hypothetical protein
MVEWPPIREMEAKDSQRKGTQRTANDTNPPKHRPFGIGASASWWAKAHHPRLFSSSSKTWMPTFVGMTGQCRQPDPNSDFGSRETMKTAD